MKTNDLDFIQSSLTKSELDLLNTIIKLVVSKRPDQLRFVLNEYLNSAPVNAINKIHDSLYKNSDEIKNENLLEKTIWDLSINKFQNNPNWIRTLFLDALSQNELAIMKSLNLKKDSLIASLGSCFATNISRHFKSIGYQNTYTLRVEEAVNSPKLVSMYLNPSMVKEEVRTVWDSRFGIESKSIIDVIPRLDLLVLTFGVGYDLVDPLGNLVLDPSNVSEKIKNNLYKFESPEVSEQAESICNCINAIRSLNKNIPIFITISPVPLSGFVGDIHVLRANTISKANLALAINVAQSKSEFIYIPTYEVVTSIAPVIFKNYIWGEDGTSRHPNNALIKSICEAFISLFECQ